METSTDSAKDAGKENIDSSLDKLKNSHFEEVFEEAVDVLTPTIDSENRKNGVGGNMEPTVTLENREQNSKSVSEIQKLEEAIGLSDAALDSENFDAQPDLLMNKLHPRDTHIDAGKVVMGATNGLPDETEEKEVELNEVVHLAPNDGETDDTSYKDALMKISKPEVSVSENATSLRTLTSVKTKNLDADTGQESAAEVFETPKFDELNGIVSDSQKSDVKRYIFDMAEIQDGNEVKGSDIDSMKPENGLSDHITLTNTFDNENTKTEDDNFLREQSEMTRAIEANGSEGYLRLESKSNGDDFHIDERIAVVGETDPQLESKANRDVIQSIEKNDIVNEPDDILYSGYQQEKSEILANQLLELKEDGVGEQEEKSYTSFSDLVDVGKTKLTQLNLESVELQKIDSRVVDDENKGVSVADTSASDDVKEGSGVNINLPSLVANGTADMEMEKDEKPYLGSSEVLQSPTSFQKDLVGTIATVSAIAEVPDKERVKDDMKEQSVSENREQKGGHMLSSAGDSSASTTYPPGPELTAKISKLVSENTSVNGRKEVKPKGEISSSDTITTHPAGLGNTAPLLQPTQNTSGNKESGSRSVVDIPSITFASAVPSRPAGLGQNAPLLETVTRVSQQTRVNGATSPPHNQLVEDQNGDAEEYDETREKLQMIRVKFLRLSHRLGQTPHNVVVAQVLYRLGLAEQLRGRSGGRVGAFSFDRASAMAEQLEASGQEPLDFTCTIMVLGKSGVGKSATINSIFDEVMFDTNAFQLGTNKVQDIVGTVQGIRVRVIDTPGLLPSWSDQQQNEKILHSVKRFIKKTPPDIVLYLDRLDMQGRDFSETPLLRTITEIFGPSIWFNAIVVLTHAASAPPEGPNGTTSYDMFVTQRSHIVQQAIRQAAGDMRLMNPVALVENHSACRTNRAGQRVLPNGQVWKPHLLLLSFASKILAEANTLLKLQDSPPGRPFASRTRSPPLPFLLSSLLQSKPEVKLPSEQFGDDGDAIDDDLDDSSDAEDDVDYDMLPPFKSLTKAQLEKLPKSQRKAYYDELEYREKLFMQKQLKEEKNRRKMMKKMQEAMKELPFELNENAEEESAGAASLPVPMPDLALPASFDSDNPTHRYRSLDSSPWLVRAVLEPNGWDHDIGYDGINVERLFVVKEKIPISFSGHISKDKKDANLQMEFASSVKHGKGKATSLGFDMQSVGKDMAYTMRSDTRFSNHRINKAAAGFSATLLGDVLTGGIKVEDKLLIGKRGQLVVSGGGIYGRGDVAYGGSLEATLRNKDRLGRFLSTLGISVMDWHGDLAIGCNSQTQIPVGRHSNLIARFNINNRGSGQVSVRISSSEQLQIVLLGLIPLVNKFIGDKSG